MGNSIENRIETIIKIIEEVSGIPLDKISADSTFMEDLELSSLEILSIVAEAERTFSVKISEKDLVSIRTVRELAETINKL